MDDQFQTVFDRGIGTYIANSAFATVVSTLFVLLLALPAAYALSIRPVRKTQDVLFLSAAATIASVPVVLAGWVAQRQLVRGLSMGAVK